MMNARRWTILAGVATLVAALALLAPLSFAQTPTPGAGPGQMGGMGQSGRMMGPMHGQGGRGGTGMHQGPGMQSSLIAVAAEQLELTVAELRVELEAGRSIADVANAKGLAPGTIVEAFVAQHKLWLDQQVAAGRLSQADADARLALMKEHATAQINQAGLPQPGSGPGFVDEDGDGVCDHAATMGGGMGGGMSRGMGRRMGR